MNITNPSIYRSHDYAERKQNSGRIANKHKAQSFV